MKVVFVGQNPSEDNDNAEVAFVGSRSYSTLVGWLVKLGLKEKEVMAINASSKLGAVTLKDIDQLSILSVILQDDVRVITLGNYASVAVMKVAYENKIEGLNMFALPHPSGLNRKLNDKEALDKTLEDCRRWLHGPEDSKRS